MVSIFAQEYTSDVLVGGQILPATLLSFEDPVCDNPVCDGLFNNCEYKSYIELGVGPLSDPDLVWLAGVYSLEVDVKIDYIDTNGALIADQAHTLKIEFNKDGGTFINKDLVLIDGGYNMDLTVMAVRFNDPDNATVAATLVPEDVYLRIGAKVDRFQPVVTNTSQVLYTNGGNFINLNWQPIDGAETYDLEWTWIDTDTDANIAEEAFNFKYNSTRVNTALTNYQISNIYREGAIVARIRARGRLDCSTEATSNWSMLEENFLSQLTSGTDYIPVNGHLSGFNWQHTRTYAEEGKSKDVISYFDGTLRSRQTVTKNQTDGFAIVAENYYDHLGRSAVQALPAPAILADGSGYASEINYYPNFNVHNNGFDNIPYNRNHFEGNLDGQCNENAKEMSNENGSGKYYSENNPIKEDHQAYVPNAINYPFSHAIYTQDKTGRLRSQRGPGFVYHLLGKDTRYYYGVPEQQELDRLFGNDVGYQQYYEKNIVVDPNGQVSISYLDNKKRVVATALAGTNPNQLDTLGSYNNPESQFQLNSSLSELNQLRNEKTREARLELNKQLLITENGTVVNLDYSLTPQDFLDNCAPELCLDCAYEVKLVVIDECGAIVAENPLSTRTIEPTTVDADCEENPVHEFTVSIAEGLDVGSYGINKTTTLNKEIMDSYEELFVVVDTCITSEIDIFTDILTETDLSGCVDPSCISACLNEVNKDGFNGNTEQYIDALKSCLDAKVIEGICNTPEVENVNRCGLFKLTLITDMSPFGQYGKVTNEENIINSEGLPCTSFYKTDGDNIFGVNYTNIDYMGTQVELNGVLTNIGDLTLEQFVNHYDESWAEFIIPYHPEHAFLEWCEDEAPDSYTFLDNLYLYDYETAFPKNYLNPLGHDPDVIGYEIGGGIGLEVPGAFPACAIAGDCDGVTVDNLLYSGLRNKMENFTPIGVNADGTPRFYSIWDIAYIIALSNTLSIGEILANGFPEPGQWDDDYSAKLCRTERYWEAFRALYKNEKEKYERAVLFTYLSAKLTATDECEPLMEECFGSTGECCGCDEWEVIQKRFLDYETIQSGELIGEDEDGDSPLSVYQAAYNQAYDERIAAGDSEEVADQAGIEAGRVAVNGINADGITEQCDAICDSYRSQWANELAGCGFSDDELNALLQDLEDICKSTCDVQHPMGASDNPATGESFEIALANAISSSDNITMADGLCNDLLISAPPAFETDVFAGAQPFIDDCVCDRYTHVYDEYAANDPLANFSGFYDYLVDTYNIEYTADDIIDIDCACRNLDIISPEFILDTPTGTSEIPEPFACVACVDCDQAANLYNTFLSSAYGGYYSPITKEVIAEDEFRNAFTAWFNRELNFNLSFGEYTDFFSYCGFFNEETIQEMNGFRSEAGGANISQPNRSSTRSSGKSFEIPPMNTMTANPDLTFELAAAQSEVEAGSTIQFEILIRNNGTTTIDFDYLDQLPGGWTFAGYPTDLFGGSLNVTATDIMSVSGLSLAAGEEINWTISTAITNESYVARNYYHQAIITESPDDLTYSDDPATTEEMDATGVYLNIEDPCLGPIEEADQFADFLNELVTELNSNPNPTYPIIIPLSAFPSFGPNSSLNLWPYLSTDNIQLEIPDPALTNGNLTILFSNDCGVTDILCSITFDDLTDLSTITEIVSAGPTSLTNEDGNFILEIEILSADGNPAVIFISSSCYSLEPCDGRLLCNRSIALEGELTNSCVDYIFDLVKLEATREFETLVDDSRQRFRIGYSMQCMSNIDKLDLSLVSREYHHTLYYYDQSGSLLRTVPPKGVKILNSDDQEAVVGYRKGTVIYPTYPEHSLKTNYQYNSYNQIKNQVSPDATETVFYYDRLGRVVASQDGRQRTYADPRHSYSIYDGQGRIIEAGEVIHAAPGLPMSDEIAFSERSFDTWLNSGVGTGRKDVVVTIYDNSFEFGFSGNVDTYFEQNRPYLRKRVSSSLYYESYSSRAPGGYAHGTHYDYDVHGNVKTLIQEFPVLSNIAQDLKVMDYDYDLVSGNVNKVSYQAGKPDAFYHRYAYDADNRIVNVQTSKDDIIWDTDASYDYYDHGPLARTELGEQKVQGCDYVYTIEGWIKSVNSNTLVETRDVGKDGAIGHVHEVIAADAYGYSLGYYSFDYFSIQDFSDTEKFAASEPSGLDDMFNGNIRSMVTAIKKPDGTLLDVQPSVYKYDQLHRIKEMQKYQSIDNATNSWSGSTPIDPFHTDYTYDPNGNLLNLSRKDENSITIDDLSYTYDDDDDDGTNQLLFVGDSQGSTVGDFAGQTAGNYSYDDSGNLVSDIAENIEKIEWNVHGKINLITRPSDADLSMQPNTSFRYGPMGNRTIKVVQTGPTASDLTYTYYVRDASGNVMGIYEGNNSGGNLSALYLKEQHLYGNSRLGIKQSDIQTENLATYTAPLGVTNRIAGQRFYELSNHLGNVLSTVSDNKLLAYEGTALPKYKAEIISYSDYYPFGWEMPGRGGSSGGYRYGFNGMEKDDAGEFGSQIHLSTYYRIYNPAIGRWFSLDPKIKEYPWISPYAFSNNNPLLFKDAKGDDPITAILEGFVSFAIEAGLDFAVNYLLDDQELDEAYANVNWAGATYEGLKSTITSIILPAGSNTLAKLNKARKTKIGRVLTDAIIASTEEIGKRYANGDYNDSEGNFDISKVANADEFQNVFIYGLISSLVDEGFSKKAQKLKDKFSKSNNEFSKQVQKLTKNIENKNSQKVISNRVAKVRKANEDIIKTKVSQQGQKAVKETTKKSLEQTNDRVIKE